MTVAGPGWAVSGAGVTVGRFTMPTHVGKRLVAVDDTVFVTLGPTAPVTALDAATGKVLVLAGMRRGRVYPRAALTALGELSQTQQ